MPARVSAKRESFWDSKFNSANMTDSKHRTVGGGAAALAKANKAKKQAKQESTKKKDKAKDKAAPKRKSMMNMKFKMRFSLKPSFMTKKIEEIEPVVNPLNAEGVQKCATPLGQGILVTAPEENPYAKQNYYGSERIELQMLQLGATGYFQPDAVSQIMQCPLGEAEITRVRGNVAEVFFPALGAKGWLQKEGDVDHEDEDDDFDAMPDDSIEEEAEDEDEEETPVATSFGYGSKTRSWEEFAVVRLEGLGAMAYLQYAAVGDAAYKIPAHVPPPVSKPEPAGVINPLSAGTSQSTNVNAAYLFIKPHAANDKVAALAEAGLRAAGLKITKQGELGYAKIDADKLIDNHYGAIAAKATKTLPSELSPSVKAKADFAKAFGLEWSEALANGSVYNAMEGSAKLGLDAAGLDAKWGALSRGVDLIKFGGGFYAGKIGSLYIINGFYMAMRAKYTTAPASIRFYTVEWPAEAMSWEDFRGKLIGATDPSTADAGSLRGKVYAQWESLGLGAQPDVGDNGIHASASPFEGLAERLNWVGADLATDTFGKKLLDAGVPKDTVTAYTQDPQVQFDGEMTSLFDLLEDTDADACCAKMAKAFKETPVAAKKPTNKRQSFIVHEEKEPEKQITPGRKMSHAEVSLKFGADEYDHKSFEPVPGAAGGAAPEPQGCCIIS